MMRLDRFDILETRNFACDIFQIAPSLIARRNGSRGRAVRVSLRVFLLIFAVRTRISRGEYRPRVPRVELVVSRNGLSRARPVFTAILVSTIVPSTWTMMSLTCPTDPSPRTRTRSDQRISYQCALDVVDRHQVKAYCCSIVNCTDYIFASVQVATAEAGKDRHFRQNFLRIDASH